MSSDLRDKIISRLKVIGEESEGEYGYYPDKRPIDVLLDYGLIPLDKANLIEDIPNTLDQ